MPQDGVLPFFQTWPNSAFIQENPTGSLCCLRKPTSLFSPGLHIGDAPVRKRGSSSFFSDTPLSGFSGVPFLFQPAGSISLRFLNVQYPADRLSPSRFFRNLPASALAYVPVHLRADRHFLFWPFVLPAGIPLAQIPRMPRSCFCIMRFLICLYQQIPRFVMQHLPHPAAILPYLFSYYLLLFRRTAPGFGR